MIREVNDKDVFGKGIPLSNNPLCPTDNLTKEDMTNQLTSKMVNYEMMGKTDEANKIYEKIELIKSI